MKVITSYIAGLKFVFQYKKMVLHLFLVNLLFGFIGILPIRAVLNTQVGKSTLLQQHYDQFNYTFITELMRHYGDVVSVYMHTATSYFVFYLLVGIFIIGGVLQLIINKNEYHFSQVIKGGLHYFWRLFRLTIYFLIIHAVVLIIAWSLFYSSTNQLNIFALESDRQIVQSFKWIGLVYLFISGLLLMTQDVCKVFIASSDEYLIWKPIQRAIKFILKNPFTLLFLFLLNMLTFFIVFGIYWMIRSNLILDTMAEILLLFFFGQALIITRIGLKIANLSSFKHLKDTLQA